MPESYPWHSTVQRAEFEASGASKSPIVIRCTAGCESPCSVFVARLIQQRVGDRTSIPLHQKEHARLIRHPAELLFSLTETRVRPHSIDVWATQAGFSQKEKQLENDWGRHAATVRLRMDAGTVHEPEAARRGVQRSVEVRPSHPSVHIDQSIL